MLYAVSIPTAVLGAVFLSAGALLQRRGVRRVEGASSGDAARIGLRQALLLLRRPSWLAGTIALVLAVVLQLVSVANAPLIVIQPIGALALVFTALIDARVSRTRMPTRLARAILVCLAGVTAFVAVTASTASDPVITRVRLFTVLGLLAVVVVVLGGLLVVRRRRLGALPAVIGAGVANGFVATVGKVFIRRFEQHVFDGFTLVCLVAVLSAGGIGIYLVQTAYAGGSASLVIAGLTVIDPIVAVLLGITVLGETSHAPAWALVAYVLAGAVAVLGVVRVARAEPAVSASA